MNLPDKTVFAGSFFQVEDAGRDYIISEFQTAHGDDAPFVGYDKECNAFHFKSNDPETINLFLGTLGRAIELWTSRKRNDLTDSPRLQPLPNTTLPTMSSSLRLEDLRPPNNALIDFEYDSDDSTENSSSTEGGNSLFWYPAYGDTTILFQDVAIALADLTECFIFHQAENKRVHLMHGNASLALEKLIRLEPLLDTLHRHRDDQAARVDQSLLCLSSENPGNAVVFAPVTTRPHIDRIMVHPELEDRLEGMLIQEERQWDNQAGRYMKPGNLKMENISPTGRFSPSNIWATFEMPAIGNPANALPRPSPSASLVSVNVRKAPDNRSLQPSAFMPAVEQAKLAQWSMNIDRHADPRIPAEKPVEPEANDVETGPLTKRLVARSDSDDEDVAGEVSGGSNADEQPLSKRLVADSDSEDEPAPRQPYKGTEQEKRRYLANPTPSQINTNDAVSKPKGLLPPRLTADTVRTSPISSDFKQSAPIASRNDRTISAVDFYAGIPREEEAEASVTKETQAPQRPVSSPTRHKPKTVNRPRRGFGFDGATDELENGHDPLKTATLQSSQPPVEYEEYALPYHPRFMQNAPEDTFRPKFDPSSYGLRERTTQRTRDQQSPAAGRRSGTVPTRVKNPDSRVRNVAPEQHTDNTGRPSHPVPPMPRAAPNARSKVHTKDRGRQTAWNQNQPNVQRLVDINEDEDSSPTDLKPPPGFDLRTTPTKHRTEHNLIDAQLDEIQRPALKPFTDHMTSQIDDNIVSSSSSSTGRNSLSEYVPQTHIPKPDINFMRNSILDSLQSSLQAKQRKQPRSNSNPIREKIAEDEKSTRKYYNTMNLQAGNPGKAKKKSKASSGKGDDASDAAARRARAIEEAYGPVKSAANVTSTKSRDDATPQLSQRAQNIARKNPALAALHPSTLQSASRSILLKDLHGHLKTLFRVASVFPGNIDFEIQFGQILVSQSSRINLKSPYEPHKWSRLFSGPNASEVFHSNILTNNGADMDRLIESKLSGRKMWNKNKPGRSKVTLRFRCQDQSGAEFLLECDENGNHYITKGVVEIAKIGIHCPGRIWDACVSLHGTPKWQDIPPELMTAVDEFVKNLHIKPGPIMTVFHRLPAKSALTVQDVVIRRISSHQGMLDGEADLVLQVTETKTLYTQSHQKDKRLFKSFEVIDYQRMARDCQVYYTASISHSTITKELLENRNLEIGESQPTEWSIHELLVSDRIDPLINAAIRQVDQIDWMGGHNYGTIQHKFDVKAQRDYEVVNTLPPTAMPSRFARPIHMTAGLSVAGPRSVAVPRTNNPDVHGQTTHPVYGIRMGEFAETYRNPDGSLYRLGRGGAHIPVNNEDPSGILDQDVMPDDSASQIGTSKKVKHLMESGDKPNDFW